MVCNVLKTTKNTYPKLLFLLLCCFFEIYLNASSTTNINNTTRPPQQVVERKARPLTEQALNCPRCNSTNTKFCYYNNYSLTQPRYFCKACKRYWTQGGSLRNVPVGGGSRKNKKHSSSTNSSSSSSSNKIINLHPNPNPIIIPPPPIIASSLAKPNQLVQDLNMNLIGAINSNNHFGGELSAMELLRSTSVSAMYGGGFGFHEFSSPSSINGMQENGGKLLFPFWDLKELSHVKSSNESDQQNIGQGGNPPMFWSTNANLGGSGGSW